MTQQGQFNRPNGRETIENSELPFSVDVIDRNESFRKKIGEQCGSIQTVFVTHEWVLGHLADIAYVVMGQSPAGDTCNALGNGVPLLNGPTEFGLYSPSPVQFTINPKKIAEVGDILFCVRGSTGRMNFADQKYAIGRGIAAIRHRDGTALKPFLRAIIDYKLPLLLASATGSTFPNVSGEQLLKLEIEVPPLPEQLAIAHILGTLDDKIELNRRMNETLESMAHALFKSWFIDFDPVIDNALAAGNPIPEDFQARAAARESLGDARKPLPEDVRNLFPDEFECAKELGWVPKGWKAKALNQIIKINPSVSLKKAIEAPFVDMKALPTKGYSISEVILKAYSGGAKFQNGDVLLARITPCLENGKTGLVDFLDGDEVGFGSTEFIVLRGQGAIQTPFIACLARDARFRNHCIQSMVGSSGRQRVQNACFSNYYLAIPDQDDIIVNFQQLTQINFDKMTKHTEQSRFLTSLRDTLLPKLLSGEFRIPDAEKFVKLVELTESQKEEFSHGNNSSRSY